MIWKYRVAYAVTSLWGKPGRVSTKSFRSIQKEPSHGLIPPSFRPINKMNHGLSLPTRRHHLRTRIVYEGRQIKSNKAAPITQAALETSRVSRPPCNVCRASASHVKLSHINPAAPWVDSSVGAPSRAGLPHPPFARLSLCRAARCHLRKVQALVAKRSAAISSIFVSSGTPWGRGWNETSNTVAKASIRRSHNACRVGISRPASL